MSSYDSFSMCHVSHGHMHYVENVTPHDSHVMCAPLRLPCGIHIVMSCGTTPCVIQHSCLELREIPTILESNEIRLGSQISRDDSNGEVCFVIQDLENFRFSTCTSAKNYHFSLFQKNCIFPRFYNRQSCHWQVIISIPTHNPIIDMQ